MSRFHYKHEKVCADTSLPNGVSGGSDRFEKDDALLARKEEVGDNYNVSICHGEKRGFSEDSCKDYRETIIFSSSSSSCSTSSQDSSTDPDKSDACQQRFRDKSGGIRKYERGALLVGGKPASEQREETRLSISGSSDSIRRLEGGLGCSLSWSENRGTLDSTGEGHSYQHTRTQSVIIGCEDLSKNISLHTVSSSPDGQSHSSVLCCQTGRYSKSGTLPVDQGVMEPSVVERDHSYSRVSSRSFECDSRLRVSSYPGLKRVDALSNNVQSSMSGSGDARGRSICFQSLSSGSKVFCLEAGSIQHREGRLSDKVVSAQGLCLSPFLSDRKGFKEGRNRSSYTDFGNSSVAGSTMVPQASSTINKESNTFTISEGYVEKSKKRESSIAVKQQSKASGLVGIRKIGFDSELSEGASNLIRSSRRKGTRSRYQYAWTKWSGWCSGRQVDPVRCSIAEILNFLADLFDQGLQYNTIAGYRSAISAYHDPIDGSRVGSHPKVTTLMTGVFNERCPKPRFCFVWDVETVLRYLKSLGNDLSDKMLTLKVTMLLALTSVCRAHEIKFLDKDYMVTTDEKVVFHFGEVTKTARPGKMKPPVDFVAFPQDPVLCVLTNLKLYLDRCKGWGKDKGQLLVSHISPHDPVSTATVSRWLLEILRLSGIDVEKFKGHSTRSASSSKAKSLGISTKEILERGHWTQESTFQKFYFKPVDGEKSGDGFQRKLLSISHKGL